MKGSARRGSTDHRGSPALERICPEERLEWYRMTPEERWIENERMWSTFFELGGRLDPEPDRQSPFFASGERDPEPPDGGPGMHPLRRR